MAGETDFLRDDADYERRKREAEAELSALVIPEEQAMLDAGSYLADVGRIWDAVEVPMRRSIVCALFEAIYVDVPQKHVAEYRPKAAFRQLLLSRRGVKSGDPDGSRDPTCHLPCTTDWSPRRSRRLTMATSHDA